MSPRKLSAAMSLEPSYVHRTPDFVRSGAEWCEITQRAPSGFCIRLGGMFRPAWLAALCTGLAGHRVSIDSAHARLTEDGSWIAELNVVPEDAGLYLGAAHYIDLARTGSAHSSPPRVIGHELASSTDHGGTLKLSIEALDRLGLLGGLLAMLAELALYPVEMHIETHKGRAYDCLWLAQLGAARPSAAARRALDRVLSTALQA